MAGGGLSFELARLEDSKAIAAMRDAASADLYAKLQEGRPGKRANLQTIRARIKCADPGNLHHSTLYVACRNGDVVGNACVSTWPPNFWKKHYWREPGAEGLGVTGLLVFPHQRQGIGRFIMESIEDLARSHGIPFVRLDAFTTNPFSNAFYRSIGYEARIEIELRGTGLTLYEKDVRRS